MKTIPPDVLSKYFASMVTYRITGLISSLTALQMRLLARVGAMTSGEMDDEINRLEDLKRALESAP